MHQHLYSRHIGQTSLKFSAFYIFFFLFQCNAHGLLPLNGLSVNRFTRSKSRRLGNHVARFGSALGAVYTGPGVHYHSCMSNMRITESSRRVPKAGTLKPRCARARFQG